MSVQAAVHGDVALTAEMTKFLAMATGDLGQALREEVREVLRKSDGDRYKALDACLARLEETGTVSAPDRVHLRGLIDVLRDTTEHGVSHETVEKVRRTYHKLLADNASSPVAVAIASAVHGEFRPVKPVDTADGVAYAIVIQTAGQQGAIIGGFVGAVTGAIVGGGFLGAVGAGLGGAVGGAIGDCLGDDE